MGLSIGLGLHLGRHLDAAGPRDCFYGLDTDTTALDGLGTDANDPLASVFVLVFVLVMVPTFLTVCALVVAMAVIVLASAEKQTDKKQTARRFDPIVHG